MRQNGTLDKCIFDQVGAYWRLCALQSRKENRLRSLEFRFIRPVAYPLA